MPNFRREAKTELDKTVVGIELTLISIIQGLALAKYKLQAGEGQASAEQVSETLREAQRLVSNLLGDAEVQAGQLRREVAAETTRPEPPPKGQT